MVTCSAGTGGIGQECLREQVGLLKRSAGACGIGQIYSVKGQDLSGVSVGEVGLVKISVRVCGIVQLFCTV